MCVYKTYIPPINFFHPQSYTLTHTRARARVCAQVRVCIYNF